MPMTEIWQLAMVIGISIWSHHHGQLCEIGKPPVKLSITHISSRCNFGTEFDICESRETAPDDNISRWRIGCPGQVTP